MLRIMNIRKDVYAILAGIALVLPVQASPACGCCTEKKPASKAATPRSGSCCHAHGQDNGKPTSDPDQQPSSSTPRNCPHGCTSPCCLGSPPSQVSMQLLGDFFSLTPIGLIFVQAPQQPSTPTLDGVLRPPRF